MELTVKYNSIYHKSFRRNHQHSRYIYHRQMIFLYMTDPYYTGTRQVYTMISQQLLIKEN